jgi:hypothetical protein
MRTLYAFLLACIAAGASNSPGGTQRMLLRIRSRTKFPGLRRFGFLSLTFMWDSVSLNPPQTVGLRRNLCFLRLQNQPLPLEPCEAIVVRLQEVRHAA